MSTIQAFDWALIQNAYWATIIETVVCCMLIVAIVIEHRRLSLLRKQVQRISQHVKDLAAAEQRRFMLELNLARQNDRSSSRDPLRMLDDLSHEETGQFALRRSAYLVQGAAHR